MLIAKTNIVYKAFGLFIISDISLPELPNVQNKMDSIDIEVRIKDLSELWMDLADKQDEFVIKIDLVMFQVPDIAIFAIQDGNKIFVSPMKEYEEDMIRLWILGTCMGAILMQRKVYPLHGSAVIINGKAYAFVGDSGAGKSTLASAFIQQGYQFLSDDVIAISFSRDTNSTVVIPSYPQQKLWQDSLDNLGMGTNNYRSIYGRETKYNVPVLSQYIAEPIPLEGVIELVKTESGEVGIRHIEKLERFYTLYRHTFRNFLIQGLGLMEWHFKASAAILNKVDLYELCRPAKGYSAPQLVSLILTTINKGE
ncbi:aldolase [Bacillus mobilis]|uniref:aldolase n=1 Tax=Bacillus mobilis TaxID=2026190 RepID=UPI0021D05D28|nr:aldolase [Bacillus mobilis]MCU5197868.1 aldolase [Bacillus mobilis]